jgi:hypothetical protein
VGGWERATGQADPALERHGLVGGAESPPPTPGASNFLAGVAATATANAWAVGGSNAGALILHWNGTAWSTTSG